MTWKKCCITSMFETAYFDQAKKAYSFKPRIQAGEISIVGGNISLQSTHAGDENYSYHGTEQSPGHFRLTGNDGCDAAMHAFEGAMLYIGAWSYKWPGGETDRGLWRVEVLDD